MKTQIKIIVPVVIIGIVLSFLVFKTDDTKNIEVKTVENQVQISENNNSVKTENIPENKTEDLFLESQNIENIAETSTGKITEETSEPKEVSVVAEDILYPEEYDFSYFETSLSGNPEDADTITSNVGKPIKLDVTSFSKLKKGDTFEISFGEDTYTFSLDKVDIDDYYSSYTDYIINSYNNTYNDDKLSITFTVNSDNTTYVNLDIFYDGGYYKTIELYNGIGYYFDGNDWQQEFYKQTNVD